MNKRQVQKTSIYYISFFANTSPPSFSFPPPSINTNIIGSDKNGISLSSIVCHTYRWAKSRSRWSIPLHVHVTTNRHSANQWECTCTFLCKVREQSSFKIRNKKRDHRKAYEINKQIPWRDEGRDEETLGTLTKKDEIKATPGLSTRTTRFPRIPDPNPTSTCSPYPYSSTCSSGVWRGRNGRRCISPNRLLTFTGVHTAFSAVTQAVVTASDTTHISACDTQQTSHCAAYREHHLALHATCYTFPRQARNHW